MLPDSLRSKLADHGSPKWEFETRHRLYRVGRRTALGILGPAARRATDALGTDARVRVGLGRHRVGQSPSGQARHSAEVRSWTRLLGGSRTSTPAATDAGLRA